MSALAAWWRRIPPVVVDLLTVTVAAADVYLSADTEDPFAYVACVVACAALLIRRRWPLWAFALTVPAALISNILAAPVIALFSLSVRSRTRWILVAAGAVFAAAEAIGWPLTARLVGDQSWTAVTFFYQLATAAAPILLGQLVQTAATLRARIEEIETTKRHERELYAQTVLARERNQLAREMHDVVSHQVSLIAVQASALQMTTADPAVREAAASIRRLSSTTLEELRSMVMLLRAAGTRSPGLAPQPTLAELPGLIGSSGLPITVTGAAPEATSAAAQRAVYRTVQEALTNARKHAPGSPITVALWQNDQAWGVTVRNGAGTARPLELPGGGIGLRGLRERAEILGGTLDARAEAEGFVVELSLPRQLS
ncbi:MULTISPECIES: sensor histidine kinase [Microbacterium]|uniref:sensor histidine kinase n=1 Tax=Microbacterium TaxID=33882 RepID=UPI00077CCCC1|nr:MULTISPECIES: histidine kinase [Microbacterium]QOC24349.1 sensor histidine kinase [Microbacterium hominis]QOC28434.1 sensor histidine kinase [Microbacterium hominis]QYF96370.1 sensor histidine kinase [Microbacterium sp. PAMC21962]